MEMWIKQAVGRGGVVAVREDEGIANVLHCIPRSMHIYLGRPATLN